MRCDWYTTVCKDVCQSMSVKIKKLTVNSENCGSDIDCQWFTLLGYVCLLCGPPRGCIKCCTTPSVHLSVRPSLCPSQASDFLETGKPWNF